MVTTTAGTEAKYCKIGVATPGYPVNDFRLHFSGFASTEGGNSPQETQLQRAGMMFHQFVLRISSEITDLAIASAATQRSRLVRRAFGRIYRSHDRPPPCDRG